MARSILLTGATGLVGGSLLKPLLEDPDATVTCVVRATDGADLERRRQGLVDRLGLDGDGDRITVVAGDMEQPRLGLDGAVDATEIIHCAASTRFDLTLERARALNVDSVSELVDVARSLGDGLDAVHYVSTAYVVGETEDEVVPADAVPVDGAWRNTYEQTKWEAEQLLAGTDLPVYVHRPSIVVGDSKTGWTPHFRVLYEPIKWVAQGVSQRSEGGGAESGGSEEKATFDVVPCDPTVSIDVVPVDFVAAAIAAIAAKRPDKKRWLLTAGPGQSLTIGELAQLSVDIGDEITDAQGRERVKLPKMVAPEDLGDNEMAKIVAEVMQHHAPYMLKGQVFSDPESERELAALGIKCPDPREYWRVIIRYASKMDFGKLRDGASRR